MAIYVGKFVVLIFSCSCVLFVIIVFSLFYIYIYNFVFLFFCCGFLCVGCFFEGRGVVFLEMLFLFYNYLIIFLG